MTAATTAVAGPCHCGTGTWLLSEAGDFWLACAGGGVLLVGLALALHWCGDSALSAADILLAELHLGATYGAVARGRLWQRMPFEMLVVPLGILAATFALSYGGYSIVVTTTIVYLAAWHRGRQNFGIARFYQVRAGVDLTPWHGRLFRAAVYLPMVAGVAYFTSTSPLHEGEDYIGLGLPAGMLWGLASLAWASVAAYLVFAIRCSRQVHPGERWLVMANALAFGSAYMLGAWNVMFILVLAVHHEIQYLYFTYAMARRSAASNLAGRRGELRLLAAYAVWPVIGLASWAACNYADPPWLTPFLLGGLICHYWLDSRIWTARAQRLAAQ